MSAAKAQPLLALAIGLVATLGTWLVRGDSGDEALSVLLLTVPVGIVLAVMLPPRLTARAGRGIGVTAIGPEAIARWHQVRTLVLDPFRSLTTGHLVVTEVRAVDPEHEGNLRWFAGALAHDYDDPVGRAVAKLAGRGRLTNVATEPGLGIRGTVDRHPVRVGRPQWIGVEDEDAGIRIGTTVAVDVDQRPLGRITVADEVRPDAARQLDRLRRAGLTPVLAAPQSAVETERLATLSDSPAWHAETEPLGLARELAIAGTPVGLVHARPDGTAALLLVDTNDDSPTSSAAGSLGLTTPAVDVVVDAVSLAIRARRAQRRTLVLAWLLYLLPLPLAAVGLLPPLVAVGVAALTWVAVGISASSEFVVLRARPEPGHE